jgi:hypothetical protein
MDLGSLPSQSNHCRNPLAMQYSEVFLVMLNISIRRSWIVCKNSKQWHAIGVDSDKTIYIPHGDDSCTPPMGL